jgi:MFS family permease
LSRLSAPFVALQHRNFRLLWVGQLISTSGSMMQNAAILWHVSLLAAPGQKGLALGLVGLVKIVPIIAFSLVSGVVADALDRRRVALFTNVFMMLTATTLAVLTFRGLHVLWPIYALAATSAAAASFEGPARQSLIPNLVPAAHFPNAISLNTIMFQIASVVGPTAAGLTIGELGVGWAYAVNALSFLAAITGLLMMRNVPARSGSHAAEISLKAVREGLRFVFSAPIIRSSMLLDFFATFFASATVLLPIFAQDILKVGAHGYGVLYAAPALGAVVASIIMVQAVERIDRRGLVLLRSIFVYGLATVAFGFSRSFWLTFLFLAVSGAADTVSTVLRNIIRQLGTPDHLRGRMTSINMIFFMGGPQLGEMEAGAVASWLGAPVSVVLGGGASLLTTIWVARKTPSLLRYRRRDALLGPEGAEGSPGDQGKEQPVQAVLEHRGPGHTLPDPRPHQGPRIAQPGDGGRDAKDLQVGGPRGQGAAGEIRHEK